MSAREGVAKLVNDEFYVRVDVDTNEPLTIIIPTFTDWLANKLADQVRHSRVRLSEDGAVQLEAVISAAGLFTTDGTAEMAGDLSAVGAPPRPPEGLGSRSAGEPRGGLWRRRWRRRDRHPRRLPILLIRASGKS